MPDLEERKLETEIDYNAAGTRLDNWLTARFTYRSRNQWQNLVKEGEILLNDERTKNSRKLQIGDKVQFVSMREEPPVTVEYSIAYEDDHLLIINKGGNIPCHPAGPFFKNTLWYHLKQEFGDIYIANRLDRETSGLMIVAKTKEIAGSIYKIAERGNVTKRYYAVVHGSFKEPINAEGYLSNDVDSPVHKKRVFTFDKPLIDFDTSHTILEPVTTDETFSLIECTLKTGRLHQIRATLHSLGYPMVGDKLYGLDDEMYLRLPNDGLTEEDNRMLILSRQALHAYHLSMPHPVTGKKLIITCDLPEVFSFDHLHNTTANMAL